MFKRTLRYATAALSVAFVAACSQTPYAPVATTGEPIDLSAFGPKVESFVVLIDTSNSMDSDYQDRDKVLIAQDLVASFNAAVPPINFQAGLISYGKGAGTCIGYGTTHTLYGMTSYNTGDFAEALGTIECAGGTTPSAQAINDATSLINEEILPSAVIIVSDFKWTEIEESEAAIANLKATHPDVCVHTVKVGDFEREDNLIANLTEGCGSSVNSDELASGDAMSEYVANTLMSPILYEKFGFSATTLFDLDKAILKPGGKAELNNLAEHLKRQALSVVDIDIVGHTCSLGSEEYNQDLSLRRATAVKEYIVSMGVDGGIIDVGGMGEMDPIASNDTEAGRMQNRRVEVHVGTSRPAPE